VISVVAILVVASVGVGYLAGTLTQHTETLTSTSTLTTSTFNCDTTYPYMCSSTTVACPSNTTCGSVTVLTSTGQVRVDSVQATQFVCQSCGAVNGTSYVRFAVTVENIGNSPIYIPDGSGGLSSSVVANSSVPSSVLQKVPTYVCPGIFDIFALNPGQTYTMYGPSCETGFVYQQVQAGIVTVDFSFNSTTNAKASTNPTDFPNSTTIAAGFIFQYPPGFTVPQAPAGY
jgi:hypothetical protein